MARRHPIPMMAAAAVLCLVVREADAQEMRWAGRATESLPGSGRAAGILTDRLSHQELRVWESIQRVVFSKDKRGRLAHPTLHSLWRRVEQSGCTIEIELSDRRRSKENLAGQFLIDDSDSGHLAGVIRLNLAIIDRASVNKQSRSAAGYTRFQGLGQIERYAEVLGHELAHVVLALEDREYERTLRELDRAVKMFLSSRRQIGRDFGSRDAERPILSCIDALGIQMESPANEFEAKIWRELRSSSRRSWRKR